MIIEHTKQIFEIYPECIVHPVSSSGVCHDLLSKQIKKTYPEYFRDYTRLCLRNKLTAGEAYFYSLNVLFGTRFIITLTIKDKWQEDTKPALFKQSLRNLFEKSWKQGISHLAFPLRSDVPKDWLRDQFIKIDEAEKNTIHHITFFDSQ